MNDFVKSLISEHMDNIKSLSSEINRDVKIMEICGGHTNVLMKYGVRDLLPDNVKLISGPGCPVCVSSKYDIDCMIELALKGIPIATYGDMLKVPGSRFSLEQIRARGGDVFEVYSASEALRLKYDYPNLVFFGIGFETTTPMTAFLLKNGVTVYSVHKLVTPAMNALLKGKVAIDGFINPGHVSSIIGVDAYKDIHIPQVISGFSPEKMVRSLSVLLELIRDNKNGVVNAYPEAVKKEGNPTAQSVIDEEFVVVDSEWRGLGIIPNSGLEVKNPKLNAKVKYADILKNVPPPTKNACRCGEVLKGLIEPKECELYKKVCTPDNPQGACMVSEEGSCSISYRYGV